MLSVLFLAQVLVACGGNGSSFKIDGRLLNLNLGEFYVYSPDGIIQGIDTIFITAGRFSYKGTCERKGTLVIVFPNFSEQPVFVQPGKNIKFSGDVSHLKELKVTGTKDNKLMNLFRETSKDASQGEMKDIVKQFVADYPESLAAVYLVNKYFIKTSSPDYITASELFETVLAAQPDNGLLAQNVKKIKERADTSEGRRLPTFKAITTDGDTITDKTFRRNNAVIYLWASYDFESCNIQRILKNCNQDSLTVLGISLDTSLKECKRTLNREKIETLTVCDTMAFDGELVQQLGMTSLPDNIILTNGKITGRGLTSKEMRERFPDKRNNKTDRNTAMRER